MSALSAVLKGVVLGLANLLAVGLALGVVYSGHGYFEWIPPVLLFGGLPGLFGGAVIGAIAHASRERSTRVRQLTLVIAAVLAAVWITFQFGMLEIAPVACVPTIVAAIALERWTRVSGREVAR
jgi:hypothetical protein